MGALLTGFGLGVLVAAAVGPISLLCMRTVLRGSTAGGIAIGAGAAVVDAAYAALGSLGAGGLLTVGPLRAALGAVGAAVLVVLGARTLWSAFRVRLGGEVAGDVGTPRRAFLTALAATASNPSTILSWGAVFAAAGATGVGSAPLLVLGVGLGTLTWFSLLSSGLALARRRAGPRLLRAADAGSGLGLLAFGGVFAWRTAGGDG